MSRLQQNIIYTGVLIAIIGFFWAIVSKTKYEAYAVYLPQTKELHTSTKSQDVLFYVSENMNLKKAIPIVAKLNELPIGIIRVSTHYSSKKEIQAACEQNVQKAKYVAAQYGAIKVIGNCVVSDNTDHLGGANLYAYAYR